MGEFIFSMPSGWNSLKIPTTEELITWIPAVLLLLTILVCFLGLRFCVSTFFIALSFSSGFVGLHFLQPLIKNTVSSIIVFAIFTAFGGWLVYVFVCLWNSAVKKFKLRKAALFVLTYGFQTLSAACLTFLLYKFVYNGLVVDIVVSVLVAGLGLLFQKLSGIHDREMRHYEDSLQI
ncbi:MAG: hypothetical protein K5988_08795 [Lachnospiraceae bacterium]|nr:hypothetical protein [Lachnospiraceae bacterium]